MGACDFTTTARGKTAREAFLEATDQAKYEYGHSGYSGTIAEKYDFKVVVCPPGMTVGDFIDRIMSSEDHWALDKWGPCAAVETGKDEWTFFGVASS